MSVEAGNFRLSRDELNGNVDLCDARMRFVQRIGSRFRLTGALVATRVPLEIRVDPADRAALESFVASDPEAQTLRRIVIHS